MALSIAITGKSGSGKTTLTKNFVKVFALCDSVNIYDNSGECLVLVAAYVGGEWIRAGHSCPWAEELLAHCKVR